MDERKMNNNNMGSFISEMRKTKKMTQKDLAQALGITDKAVSKWERGLSYPDISLLSRLADVLGVTVSELLDGEKEDTVPEVQEKKVEHVLQYADRTAERKLRSLKVIFADVFSLLLVLGILTCSICDLAVSGSFTWSLISDSSILFAWFAGYPLVRYGKKGIPFSLAAISVLLVPFLYVLHLQIPSGGLLLPIGIWMSLIAIPYAWAIYGLFRILSRRKYLAGAITAVLCIPLQLLVNYCLSFYISEPVLDEGDIVSIFVAGVAAAVLWRVDARRS